ncbi:hypothetical protein DFH09DRAFT_1327181 [Mycena vulgaris]|nr:hypothetical protein DFH09DRAFT_1327181 [Mycena vulgaris]
MLTSPTGGPLAARRLADILMSSPHLIMYINVLYIGKCDVEVLSALAPMAWSRLHTMLLSHFAEGSHTPGLQNICSLVGLPTLRNLSLLGEPWQAAELFSIFVHCTSELVQDQFFPLHSSSGVRAQLCAHGTAAKDPSSYARVFSFDLGSTDRPRMHAGFLTEVHSFKLKEQTIQSLDLGLFPALQYIKCDDIGDPLYHVLASFSSNNIVSRVRLVLFGIDAGAVRLQELQPTIRCCLDFKMWIFDFGLLIRPVPLALLSRPQTLMLSTNSRSPYAAAQTSHGSY